MKNNCKYLIPDTTTCNYFKLHNAKTPTGIPILNIACYDDRECPIKHPENLKDLIIDKIED